MSKQNFIIEEATIVAALTEYTEKYNKPRTTTGIKIINGQAIKSLLAIYDSADALFDLTDLPSWIDSLMTALNAHIADLLEGSQGVERHVSNEILLFHVLIKSMVEIKTHLEAFAVNTKQFSE